MAKKKAEQPWAINSAVVQKKATESIKAVEAVEETRNSKQKRDFKFLKVSLQEHLKLKMLALKNGMQLREYTEFLINKEAKEQGVV